MPFDQFRDVQTGHIAPSGWWNLGALTLAGGIVSLIEKTAASDLQGTWQVWQSTLGVFVPVWLGLVMGWLAVQA